MCVTTGCGWDRVSFPHSSPHSAVLCSGTQEDVDNTPVFWDCWEVLALPTQPPCISRLGMGKIKEGGAADQRVIPYHIGFALQQKLKEWTEKRGYLLFIFVSWRNLYVFWSPAFQEVAEHHLLVGNRAQNTFFPLLPYRLCLYYIKLFLFWPTSFYILFSVRTVLLRWVLGGHLASTRSAHHSTLVEVISVPGHMQNPHSSHTTALPSDRSLHVDW